MLKDEIRTEGYRRFIVENPNLFKGKNKKKKKQKEKK